MGRIRLNSLAHVVDIVGSKKEVMKPLVAHFKHTGERKTDQGMNQNNERQEAA